MLGALLAAACGSGTSAGSGGTAPEDATAYRVVYRSTAQRAEAVEERLVRRPYESRAVTRRGDKVVGGQLTNADGKWFFSTGASSGWVLLESGPHRAAPDPRPRAVLPRALEAGLATELGSEQVAGRPCRLVRFGAGTDEELDAPTPDDHADVCVDDGTGVVLREKRVIGGETVREMVATSFDSDPEIADDAFVPKARGPSIGGAEGPEAEAALERLERGLKIELDPPEGFSYDGVSAKLVIGGSFGGDVGGGAVQRFLDGDELLELDHDPPSRQGGPATTVVQVEGVGQAALTLGLQTSILDVPLEGGRAARLMAADPDLLVEAARGLRVR